MARPRKKNVRRSASGKSRGEPHEIAPEVLAVRLRENTNLGLFTADQMKAKFGVNWETAKDQERRAVDPSDALAGFTLGVLLLRNRQDKGNPGSITQKQYDAGDRWASIVRRHASIMGYELKRGEGQVKSPSFSMVAGGRDTKADPSDDKIAEARDQFRTTYDAIMAVCRDHGIAVRDILYAVCVDNRPVLELSEADYGNLRLGLNALVRALRL